MGPGGARRAGAPPLHPAGVTDPRPRVPSRAAFRRGAERDTGGLEGPRPSSGVRGGAPVHLLLFLLVTLALLAPGCGCENQLALKASTNELDRTDRALTDLQYALNSLEVALDSEGPGALFKRASEIRAGLREALMKIRWSKNTDLVADNPRIMRKRARVAKKYAAVEKRYKEVMESMTRRRLEPAPPPEPAPDLGELSAPAPADAAPRPPEPTSIKEPAEPASEPAPAASPEPPADGDDFIMPVSKPPLEPTYPGF